MLKLILGRVVGSHLWQNNKAKLGEGSLQTLIEGYAWRGIWKRHRGPRQSRSTKMATISWQGRQALGVRLSLSDHRGGHGRVNRREWTVFMMALALGLGIGLGWTAFLRWRDLDPPHQASTVRILKAQEGFRGDCYPDAGGQSIGYGIHLPLTPAEGSLLLVNRLSHVESQLAARWAPYKDQPEHIKQALSLMAYQLGVDGRIDVHEDAGVP